MRYILLLSLTTLLLASPMAQLYLEKGIYGVQKVLDNELLDLNFWNKQLEDKNTSFGYFQNTKTLLHCDKNSSILQVYQRDNNDTFKYVKQYDAFTGEKPGDKQFEGDLKTPIGVYKLTSKVTSVDSFYGPMAFVTSYPNLYDRMQHKSGHGIWIHGLPLNKERDEYTKGCIAINNDDINCLDRHIDIATALLIIDEQKTLQSKNIDYAKLLQQLYQWRHAWIYNDLERYLSFYNASFIRFDGLTKTRFTRYKKRIFAKRELKSIDFSDITIMPYPDKKENLFIIQFHEAYTSPSMQFSGEKTLMVRYSNEQNLSIITER